MADHKRRFRIFLQLVCRPHPWSYGGSAWTRWTRHFVGPREAWHIAGVLAACPDYEEPTR
ncbi:hypothetical protein [Azospirillum sp.]|uniref:hypothetical protein n=1 Tax=Azospirillum sp. TaxID=34012 RepID=UPI002D273177|nr:hypothetical protein [Azospirillum sp.]HYF89018.1 hypothetical protein [Azospirillum sp.]